MSIFPKSIGYSHSAKLLTGSIRQELSPPWMSSRNGPNSHKKRKVVTMALSPPWMSSRNGPNSHKKRKVVAVALFKAPALENYASQADHGGKQPSTSKSPPEVIEILSDSEDCAPTAKVSSTKVSSKDVIAKSSEVVDLVDSETENEEPNSPKKRKKSTRDERDEKLLSLHQMVADAHRRRWATSSTSTGFGITRVQRSARDMKLGL